MKKRSKRTTFVNMFGGLGYLFCCMLWGWTGILYLPGLLENEHVTQLLLPAQHETVVTPTPPVETSPLMIAFAVIVTIVVIIATIVIVLRMPVTIAKTGRSVTTKAAASALPLITHGHQLPPAKKRRLTVHLIKLAKLLLLTLPVALCYAGTFFIELSLQPDLALLISSSLALGALLWFTAQYLLADMFSVDNQYLV